ncbi:MAG: amidinotransferase [Candidatus Krumholzibacteriota bacterium]|nr:amidinotransferase [Candidatus Krumholzibacteriota bacterium]
METFELAVTRRPGRNPGAGITTVARGEPRVELLREQHEKYLETLRSLGLKVVELPPLPGFPDAYFVEDTAVVTPDIAVITNPGAVSRRGEAAAMEEVLGRYHAVRRILPPGTLDGGDVLKAERHFFIGISERTNLEGARQLGEILEEYGNTWIPVRVEEGLHLKSGVSYLGDETLLLTEELAGRDLFKAYGRIVTAKNEDYAANMLSINGSMIVPRGFPATREKLEALGRDIIELDTSEIRKMDGGLSCMSIRW